MIIAWQTSCHKRGMSVNKTTHSGWLDPTLSSLGRLLKPLISEIFNYTRNTAASWCCPNQKITLSIQDDLFLFLQQYNNNRVAKAEQHRKEGRVVTVQKRGRWTENTELFSERVLRKLQSYLEEKKKSVSRNNPEKQTFCRTSVKHNDTSCILKVNWIITQAETEVCPTILKKKSSSKDSLR